MRIYVSSTSFDLLDYRKAVIGALLRSGHTPVCMEHHAAGDVVPKDECLREVAACDLYIGIFAWRFGYIPPECGESITEMEYREAVRRKIPTLVFLLDEGVEWPAKFREEGVGGRCIKGLRDELKQTKWVRFFTSPDNLAVEVMTAIIALTPLPKVEQDPKPVAVPIPIPEKHTRFFQDRDAELARLRQCLADKGLRMVSIYGRGGVGKTSLTIKMIRELSDENVVFLSLDDSKNCSPDRIVEAISRTLDLGAAAELKALWKGGDIPMRERLAVLFRDMLARHRCLIVLDNLEYAMGDDNRILKEFAPLQLFIEAFLEFDHAALLVVTSRRALKLSQDAEIAAIGRRVQISLDEGLPESFAVALLRELDFDDRLGIRTATDEELGAIARRCQYIPRTMETIVSTLLYKPTWALEKLLADEPFLAQLVENPARELYKSLSSDDERLVMQALAVYNKPVPAAAVLAMLPALPVDDILDRFVSNFVAVFDRGLFWLHPLDRQYAYSQIPEREGDLSRPALHKLAAQYYQNLPCPSQEDRKSLDDTMPILDAIEHYIIADEAEKAASLFFDSGLHENMFWWGSYLLLSDLCARFLSRNISPKRRVSMHVLFGKVNRNLGKMKEAKKIYEDALPLVGEAADPASEIGLLTALGDISYYLTELDSALDYHRRASDLLAANPIPLLQSENAGDMANVMWSRGEHEEALRLYDLAIAFSREADNKIYEGIWNGNIANVYGSIFINSGNPEHRERAVSHYLQAIAIAAKENDSRHESHWSGVLGNFYRRLGEHALAEEHLKKALSIAVKIRYGRLIDTQAEWLAAMFRESAAHYVKERNFEKARQAALSFQKAAREIGYDKLETGAERLLDELQDASGDRTERNSAENGLSS